MTDYQTLLALKPVTAVHMTPTQAHQITSGLLADKGLDGWIVRLNNARRAAGTCAPSARVITLSRYLLAQRSYEESLQTITHEVAHALTPGHSHDRVWQRQHKAMGGNGKRCFAHVDPQAPWSLTCCGETYTRYKAVPAGRSYRCPKCKTPVTFERSSNDPD